jgi:hypothetical protein
VVGNSPYEGHGFSFSRAARSRSRNLRCKNRTSAAKAVHAQEVHGTAEAVPFVQRLGCRKTEFGQV